MADTKISALPVLLTPADDDVFLIIDDPTGTPLSNRIQYRNIFGAVGPNAVFNGTATFNANTEVDLLRSPTSNTIVNSTDTGTKGDIRWDADYVYVCVATNTWRRAALTTW